ncbi:MAG: TRAP transporter substrate-binding protein [Syntrophobacterales bacterium]|nr:TRAP transporter substrate-binding protein [Syntrophobacterales bacterium]
MKGILQFTLCLFLILFTNISSHAGQEIKLGVVTKPGSAQNICAEKFKELLEGKSSKYTVTIYHSASLGTETEILQQVQLGSVHMAIITSGPFDVFVPEVRVVDYPFLFDSYDQVDVVLDGPPGQEILKRLEKAGFKGLAFSENGFRHLTNSKRPVHSVKDVEGLKIRVMESVIHKELWRLLGANPTPMGWPIYTELQQGTIDGQENPLSVIWTYKLYEVQKYLSLTKHVYSSHIDIASLKWWQGLPEEDRKLIQETMIEAARYQRKWNRDNEAIFLRNLKEAGMVVNESPDIQSFKDKVKDIQKLNIFQVREVQEVLPMFLKR